MKRLSLFIIICVALLSINSNAQVIFEDNFESYGVGDYIAENSDVWTTWSNAPGSAEDAVASDAFANSPTRSMHISGTNDMVLPLGNKTSGKFIMSFYFYVENDGNSEGYFSLLHDLGTEWAMETYFKQDGDGLLKANGEEINFDYAQGAWIYIENVIDIDNDIAKLYVDGIHLYTWPFATEICGGQGSSQLGGLNFFAGSNTGSPNSFIDDIVYESFSGTLFFENFEDYEDGAFIAESSDVWTTWSNDPGSIEDAVISSVFANSPDQAMHVTEYNDMIHPLDNKTRGQYWVNLYIYIENDGSSEGYFNLQHFEAPGTEWACEVFFLLDGTGTFEANGETTTFNYTQDTWVLVENYIDIDADTAAFYIDGMHIVTWPFATQASGGAGTAQLGCLNIYAGSHSGIPNFYVDDIEYSGNSSMTQSTDLISGWNIISWNVSQTEMNIQIFLSPLISNSQLVKVIDQEGEILEHMPWGWVNNIGDMCNPEGYQIKVNTNCQLSTSGFPVELPINIPLISGYNLMGWPAQTAEDAETALADLITAGYLVKVINESGDILQHMPWGWVNNIGDLEPGEGYQVKVNSVCTLVVDEPAGSGKHSKPQKKLPKILRAENESNPYNPMAFAIALNGNLPIGAEVGVFMDGRCLDAAVVEGDYLYLTAGSDEEETAEKEGFSEGEKFIIRYQTEAMSQPEELPLSYMEGDESFASLGTFVGELKESLGVQEFAPFQTQIRPNPVKDKLYVAIQSPLNTQLKYKLWNTQGHTVLKAEKTLTATQKLQIIDVSAIPAGMYLLEIEAVSDGGTEVNSFKVIKL